MFRLSILSVVLFVVVVCCMAQTFQYSRGWTNGKRSSGAHFHADSNFPELLEMQNTDRRLERCLVQLHRFVRNPLLIRAAGIGENMKNNNYNNNLFSSGTLGNDGTSTDGLYLSNHLSSENFNDLGSAPEPRDFTIKHQ